MHRRRRPLSFITVLAVFSLVVATSTSAGAAPEDVVVQTDYAVDNATLYASEEQLSGVTTPVEIDPVAVDADQALIDATSDLEGFAGAWVDERDGRTIVTIALTGQASTTQRTASLAQTLTSHASADNINAVDVLSALDGDAQVHVRLATYTFEELKKWQKLVDDNPPNGLVLTDADERNNSVTVGVSVDTEFDLVLNHVADLGVPVDAIRVVEADLSTTLRDAHRPVKGGQQIQFIRPIFGNTGTILNAYSCTLGVNARLVNVVEPLNGYLTNSHCSINYAQADGTYHWQPSVINDANRIGHEVLDPPLYTGNPYGDSSGSANCPSGFRCRLSDAAFGSYDGNYSGTTRGYIARPSKLGNYSSWNGTTRYRITATGAPTGTVRAVGRTSGMTTGKITQSCVRISNIEDMPGIAQNCQYIGTYSSQGGDSGGPVFRVTDSPAKNDVTFVGLNWGGGKIGNQEVGIVSSWPLMKADFSPYDIRVCHASAGC